MKFMESVREFFFPTKSHLTNDQLHLALLDLAEFGFVIVENVDDKDYIVKNCPVKTTFSKLPTEKYIIRTI